MTNLFIGCRLVYFYICKMQVNRTFLFFRFSLVSPTNIYLSVRDESDICVWESSHSFLLNYQNIATKYLQF